MACKSHLKKEKKAVVFQAQSSCLWQTLIFFSWESSGALFGLLAFWGDILDTKASCNLYGSSKG